MGGGCCRGYLPSLPLPVCEPALTLLQSLYLKAKVGEYVCSWIISSNGEQIFFSLFFHDFVLLVCVAVPHPTDFV